MSVLYVSTGGERSWKDLFPYVTPWVRRAPPDILTHVLRSAAIEFCQRTGILRERRTLDLQKGVPDYPFCASAGYQVVRTLQVSANGQCVTPSGSSFCSCGGYLFHMQAPDYLILATAPAIDTVAGMQIEFVVAPDQDSLVLDGLLYDQWGEGLAAGALSRLFLIPDVPWFNTVLAAKYERDWAKVKSRARIVAEKGHTERNLVMRAPRWLI